jgi:hypothetical protein
LGYSHLRISGKLSLFPNIVVKASDLTKGSKAKERILLCQAGAGVKRAQLDLMQVKTVILMAESSQEADELKGLSVKDIKLAAFQLLCQDG